MQSITQTGQTAPTNAPNDVQTHALTNGAQLFDFSRFNGKNDNTPKPIRRDWNGVCELLKRRSIRERKDGPLFSGASYPEGATRANENVSFVSLAILDFDGGATLDEIQAGVSNLNNGQGAAAFIYSTFSHDPQNSALKYRLVLPLASPVGASDWPEVWRRLSRHFGERCDRSRKDAAGMHYLPSGPTARAGDVVSLEIPGEPLDVATLPEIPVEPRETPVRAPEARGGDNYARRAFDAEIGRLCATMGNRNDALNKTARRLGQFIGAGRLDRAEVEAALMNAASANGYTAKDGEAEARSTMKSGLDAGEREPNHNGEPRESQNSHNTRAKETEKPNEAPEAATEAAPMFEVFSYKQLRLMPRLSWLIDRILPVDGTSWITAGAGELKSFWAIDAACCIATGTLFHGRAVKRGNVVYVAAEGATGFPDRLEAWAAKHQIDVPDAPALGIVKQPADVATHSIWAGFAASIRALKPAFIVLDTQSRCSVGRDLNSTAEATTFYDAVSRLAKELNAQILIVAHNNRSGQYAGNHQAPAMVDTHLTLKRDGKRAQFRCLKQKDGAAEELAAMDFETQVFELGHHDEQGRVVTSLALKAVAIVDEPAPEARDKTAEMRYEMMDVLRRHFPKGAGAQEWQLKCADLKICQKTTFYDRRDELKANGEIMQVRNVWVPFDDPSPPSSPSSPANLTNLPDLLGSPSSPSSSPVGTDELGELELNRRPHKRANSQNRSTPSAAPGFVDEAAGVDF